MNVSPVSRAPTLSYRVGGLYWAALFPASACPSNLDSVVNRSATTLVGRRVSQRFCRALVGHPLAGKLVARPVLVNHRGSVVPGRYLLSEGR